MKTCSLWLLPFLLGISFSPAIWAFEGLSTPFMEVLANDSVKPEPKTQDPWFIKPFHASIYNPSGEFEASEECRERHIFSESKNFLAEASRLQEFWQKCERDFFSLYIDPISQILRTTGIEFDRSEYPWAKRVIFTLETGDQLRGILFLKDSKNSRPLTVMRGGIFSSSTGIKAELYLMLMLFEQSQSNLLFLESTSSPQYQARNKRWTFLGAEEGFQLLEVIKKIQSPGEPISKLISKVNLAGISLGGNGVIFANLIQQELMNQGKAQLYQKSLALCPLVDGEKTLGFHQRSYISEYLLNRTLAARYVRLREEKGVQDLTIRGLLKVIEKESPPVIHRDFPIPSSLLRRVEASNRKFWEWNGFAQDYKNIQTPLLIFATENDSLVPIDLNSLKLMSRNLESQVQVILMKRGEHCSVPGAYQWYSFSRIVNDYLETNVSDSPKFKVNVAIGEEMDLMSHSLDIQVLKDIEGWSLQLSKKTPWWSFWKSPKVVARVPITQQNTDLNWDSKTLERPLKNHLTRWFNANLEVRWEKDQKEIALEWPVLKKPLNSFK